MISYDVCTLFTSILLKETMDIAVDLLFEHNPDFKITKNELKELFDFANWLEVFKDCERILYRRYVDDIICLFNSESDVDKFYEFLNKQHPNIKFIFKKQQNNQIIFLDILIKIIGENFSATIFRKKVTIGLFTNQLCFTPLSYKIDLAKTLIHRAFKICSNWCLFYDEVNNIKKYLKKTHTQRILLIEKLKRILKNNLILNHLKFLIL